MTDGHDKDGEASVRGNIGPIILLSVAIAMLAGFFFGIGSLTGQILIIGSIGIGSAYALWCWFGPRTVLMFLAWMAGAAAWQSVSGFGLSVRAGLMAAIAIGLASLAIAPWRRQEQPADQTEDKS
jgi:hypothetical protein